MCFFFPSDSEFPYYHVVFIIVAFFYRIGTYNVDSSYNAGLDLEMPGNNKWRTIYYVEQNILARRVTAATVKQRAKKVLELVKKCAKGAPEVSALFVPQSHFEKKT